MRKASCSTLPPMSASSAKRPVIYQHSIEVDCESNEVVHYLRRMALDLQTVDICRLFRPNEVPLHSVAKLALPGTAFVVLRNESGRPRLRGRQQQPFPWRETLFRRPLQQSSANTRASSHGHARLLEHFECQERPSDA